MRHLNLETKNKKAYHGAAKFKTNEDRTWEDFQSVLYIFAQENNQVSLKKRF